MTTSALADADFDYVRRLLADLTGFVLGDDKHYLVELRLTPVAIRASLPTVGDLVSALRTRSRYDELHRATIEAMLNGETSFFRDVGMFQGLEREILPRLIAERADERRLDIWCAACSTGQEPYSLAMSIAERFPQLADWDVRIVATDLSSVHLARARLGRYAQFEVNRGLPASLLVKYFDQEGTDWRIASSIRERVKFMELNLMDAWPLLPPMDLVLLRNVMIYWDVTRKQQVLGRVRRILRPTGYLVLGAAETTYYVDPDFEPFGHGCACCFRLAEKPTRRTSLPPTIDLDRHGGGES